MPRRLLIVEDETPLCAVLRAIFADAGYAVETAADGRDGWERLARGGFDLVLANTMLPYLDGYELLRRVRADPAVGRIPFVLMSAGSPATAAADGVTAYVAKPFDLDRLLATVERMLRASG
jgi:two-component system OmpR family response regulator